MAVDGGGDERLVEEEGVGFLLACLLGVCFLLFRCGLFELVPCFLFPLLVFHFV